MSSLPDKLEAALAAVDAIADARARAAAHEVVAALLELERDALRRLCARVREAGPDGERLLAHAAEDEVVASLLLVHGLHPAPLVARVRRALEAAPHEEASSVEIISIDDTGIRLRVLGSDKLRRIVADVVREAAPEVEHVEVLGRDPALVPVARLLGKHDASHDRCDLCGVVLASEHDHVLHVEQRRLECTCPACSLLFDATDARLRRVRKHKVTLTGFRLDDALWHALGVPVGLAFFFVASLLDEVIAAYPGPAGAVESPVPRAAWAALVAANPMLADLEPDTSALLIDRRGATPAFHLLSIDECFRLTGLVRSRWQGITGGDGPARAIEGFFAELREERP